MSNLKDSEDLNLFSRTTLKTDLNIEFFCPFLLHAYALRFEARKSLEAISMYSQRKTNA